MNEITAEYIFSRPRYKKMEDYVHKISEGKSRRELRIALRRALNDGMRAEIFKKRKSKLFAGLCRSTSLLQIFIFKSVFSDESNLEKMIPERADRLLVGYIMESDYEHFDSYQLEAVIISELSDLSCKQSPEANMSLVGNFHEIIAIIRKVIDEL